MRDAVRVALLARPGAGADRLRAALTAAGGELVLEADPTSLEPAALSAAAPESVVVLLDAAVEEALDRLDPVLHDPAIDVLYEEAEVAAAREGWDAARWTRHLSAKLMRHGDVLPPGREADGVAAPPASRAAPPAVAQEPAAVPEPEPASEPEPAPVPAPTLAPVSAMFDPVAAEYDADEADTPVEPLSFQLDDATDLPTSAPPVDEEAPLALDLPDEAGAPDAADAPDTLEMPDLPAPAEAAQDTGGSDPDWSALTLSLEGEEPAPPPPAPPAAVPKPAPTPAPSLSGTPDPSRPRSDALRDFRRDLASIEQRIASMGLVEDAPPADAADAGEAPAPESATAPLALEPDAGAPTPAPTPAPEPDAAVAPVDASGPQGAVLVFAGIGGPDAVRQFLGALPEAFPRPVLIHQRLDGGRHDRLVQQMARATTLPVQLAVDGEAVVPAHVYILPPGLRLATGDAGLRFAAGDDPMATLPADGSAVLMFSGSDTSLVDAAMDHAQAGALVAGQSPEDCYDAAAADALVARGAESGQPAELARRLAERWAA